MALMIKRWCKCRRYQFMGFVAIILCINYYIFLYDNLQRERDLDVTRRFIEKHLQEALKEDKGTGCEIPHLDPFSREVAQFDKTMPKVVCEGTDWVKCYLSKCRVIEEILVTIKDVVCWYQDIVHYNDDKHVLAPPVEVRGADEYTLIRSDHVKITCTGKREENFFQWKWTGHAIGFRTSVERVEPPPGREDTLNVLIFGFDSTSKNGFIRKMPKSYKYLTEVLNGTVLNGYNIVGSGTPGALFPILTGKNELEMPDVRKNMKSNGSLDSMPFIFYKLKEDGYRTAYFEDMPWIGTFQYRFKGFEHQPADHYLRSFFQEETNNGKKWWSSGNRYCVGDTPQYKLMMNITDQFLKLDGKRFCFTFVADITHDDINMISTADEDFVKFLETFRSQGRLKDTLLVVMGDHGPRFAAIRDTFQGKLEERLPLMTVILPEDLRSRRPDAQGALESNAGALTSPHDIHATILDVLNMTQHLNPYKVLGADYPRAMSLLKPIPRNRSCSEAGIQPHWCACLAWQNVSSSDPMHQKTADAFIHFINSLTEPVRSKCVPRTLTSISWVMRQHANSRMLAFDGSKDADGYLGKFSDKVNIQRERETYQLKVIVGPGRGLYEASMTYQKREDKFNIDTRDISRTNAYNDEPSCISATDPHLNMFCYCKDFIDEGD